MSPVSARIAATGSFLPSRAVPNDALTQFPRSVIPRISEKTGVKERRVADENRCTSDLGIEAGRRCLDRAGLDPRDVDAVILATSSPDRIQPATATRVQHGLGAGNAYAFDINSVCSGAVYGLHLAHALIRAGFHRNVLLVAAEVYSRFLNPEDFGTYPYFGDGAGAALIRAHSGIEGIQHTLLGSDGSGCDLIQIPGGGSMRPHTGGSPPTDRFFTMQGKAVYEFAVSSGTDIVKRLLKASSKSKEQIRYFVPHQANINIIREIAGRLNVPAERFVVNLDRYGNTAAASVLIALDELLESRNVRAGDLLVILAFGGGLSWGASLIQV